MCGIAGVLGFNDSGLLRRMIHVMRHRGPDSEGYYEDNGIMLGNCRLSIIDLAGGNQPIYNEDKSVVVVYNGAIYNFQELRQQLESLGHTFESQSDTEVIVHQYEEDGIDCVKKFNGMFAFALWDSTKKTLILARDPVGIKPLYYAVVGNSILFSSEVKSILQYSSIRPILDLEAAYDHINLRFLPYERTLFQGIKKLMPGHVLASKPGSPIYRKAMYWDIINKETIFSQPPVKELSKEIENSVARHLISDVDLGVFLSGGLDSSVVAAFAQKLSKAPIKTFCMGFGEETDELEDAKMVADHLGTDHREIIISPKLEDDFANVIWHADAPKRNLYPYYLAQFARQYVKVALGGLGGDELFGGYTWRYEKFFERARIGKLSSVEQKADAYLSTYAIDLLPADEIRQMVGPNLRPRGNQSFTSLITPFFSGNIPTMEQVLIADFKLKLPHDFLTVDDATSSANGLETRTPLLDLKLIDLAFSIPFAMKVNTNGGKQVLCSVVREMLPPEILSKKKQGFGPDAYNVFVRKLREVAKNVLPDGQCVKKGFFDPIFILRVLNAPPDRKLMAHYIKIWDMLAFEMWYRMYFEEDFDQVCTRYSKAEGVHVKSCG